MYRKVNNGRCQGLVVQSIVSFTSLFRGELVKYFMTLLPNTLIFFIENNERCFCNAKASHIFSIKNIDLFQILIFEILTKRELMTSLFMNNHFWSFFPVWSKLTYYKLFVINGLDNFYSDVHKLTLKAPITTAADDIHKYFFIVFSEKIRLDVSSESSARQRIHMKNQALFSSKDKVKN